MRRLVNVGAVGLLVLSLSGAMTGSSLAAKSTNATVSVTIGGSSSCTIKWSATNLTPGASYTVGVYAGTQVLAWGDLVVADSRGSIRVTDDSQYGAELNKTHTFTARLVDATVTTIATDDDVANHCNVQ